MLIGFSLASFYHLDNTPSFRGSIENGYFFVSYLLFIQMCRLFIAFNIWFVIFSAMDNEKAKSDYYDEDEYYGDLNDLDDYEEI
jgi:hypothetical protein